MKRVRIYEVRVLRDNRSLLALGDVDDLSVGCVIGVGQIQRMDRVTARSVQPSQRTSGQLRVNEKLHDGTGCRRRVRANRAA